MPQKSTKQTTTTKKNIKESDVKKKTTIEKVKKTKEQKDPEKKVVIKRRKKDLTPTKASATAIISQANRAKKQALIEKLSEEKILQPRKVEKISSSSKVPLWVRILFGCSLLWFCIAFYLAIIHPQLEIRDEDIQVDESFYRGSNVEEENLAGEADLSDITNVETDKIEDDKSENDKTEENSEIIPSPQNPEELIQSYFAYMSQGKFDESFSLFDKKTQKDKNIKDLFATDKMAPFFEGIEGNTIIPQNIKKTSEIYKGKNVYTFDISYKSSLTQEQYDETRKFATNDNDGDLKILMLYCISNGCSKHPIFGS